MSNRYDKFSTVKGMLVLYLSFGIPLKKGESRKIEKKEEYG